MELNRSKLLGYFLHEFGLFARILFLFGFIFFLVGMVQSVSYRNPTLVPGVTPVLFSLSRYDTPPGVVTRTKRDAFSVQDSSSKHYGVPQ